jgi:hypothetical protein
MVYRQIIYPGSGRVSGQHLCTENKHRETIFVKKRSSGAQSLYGKEASGHYLGTEKEHRDTIFVWKKSIGA